MSKINARRGIKFGIACLLIFFTFILMRSIHDIQRMSNMPEGAEVNDSIPAEDSSLFDEQYRPDLIPDKIYREKGMPVLSLISFGNDYRLFIYGIDLLHEVPLRKVLSVEIKSSSTTTRKVYVDIKHNPFIKFQYLDELAPPVSRIFMTISGDSLQNVIENDIMWGYHLRCKNLAIRYTEQGPVTIFMEGKDGPFGTLIVPANLMLIKRQKKVYLIVMTPNDLKKGIPADLLYNIVRKN